MTHIRPIFCVALRCCAVLFALPAAAAGIIYGPRNAVDPSDPEPYFSANLLPKQIGCDINKQGYQVCIETGLFFSGPQLYTGMFWLELSNAQSQNNGWIGWDINNGVGCTSTPYCPSQAVDAFGNTVGSHSFVIFGGAGQIPTPEPM